MHSPGFLKTFDAIKNRVIFCLWTGEELMSENRLKALWTIFKTTSCPVVFITEDTVLDWIHPDYPLHPAYETLSSTHKSDYLRCYLMHHYGGGYTDIKQTCRSWAPFFRNLEASESIAVGYRELAHGIPHVAGEQGDIIRAAHAELIGLCAFIFKRKTILTESWYAETNRLLDLKSEELKHNPAKSPQDQNGLLLSDGKPSQYPLRWAELLGEILHPLFYAHRAGLLQEPIEPVFFGYR
jgi:hypothetical protein